MTSMWTVLLAFALATTNGGKEQLETMDIGWTRAMARPSHSTQVVKWQEPADAGSETAERAGYN